MAIFWTLVQLSTLGLIAQVSCAVTADGPWWDSYGLQVDMLGTPSHNVKGLLVVADNTHFRLVDFTYDGTCTNAKFLVNAMGAMGTTPVSTGTQVPDENGMMGDLGIYRDADVTLTLPTGRTVTDVTWFAIWCDSMSAGQVAFPSPLGTVPAPKVIGPMTPKAHGVSSDDVIFLDAKTIRIMNFKYDGQGPDAFFVVGLGTPADHTVTWKVPDETGSTNKARQYTGETVDLTLPKWLTVKDIDWLSMYCIQFSEDFGNIMNPDRQNLMVPPAPNPEGTEYFGQMLGRLDNFAHEVRGELYIVDDRHLRLRHFYYDGQGPDAFFWVGKRGDVSNAMEPDGTGVALRDEMGRGQKLAAYDDADIILTLNDDLQLSDLVWISVWCKQVAVNFGSFLFPDTLPAIPMPADLGPLSGTGATATGVMVTDAVTFSLTGFTYDGNTSDTFFLAGMGPVQGNDDTMYHMLADEMGGTGNLRAYDMEDVTLMLLGGATVWDIDWFSVYSTSTGQSLATLMITDKFSLLVPPYTSPLMMLANCETLHDHLNVGWQIDGQYITIELNGALIEEEYMAFGLSGSSSGLAMLQADHTAAYYTDAGPMAVDYYNSDYSLCSAGAGVCPDTDRGGMNNNMVLLGDRRDGITTIRYRRPLQTGDASDKAYPATGSAFIIWAIGPLNNEGMVTKHQERITVSKSLDFGRTASYSCTPVMPREASLVTPWPARMLSGEGVNTFRVNLGPTGGDRGYKGTTGFNSWGIAWYVNGQLIPELTLKRGEMYTFTVEGGDDPSNQAQFHPFYITDDPIGGYKDKSAAERAEVEVYAGVDADGNYTAIGRYCDYIQGPNVDPDTYSSFSAYANQLTMNCPDGVSGSLTWTPNEDTPDLVYYQCYTHNYLGWKIHVVDDYEVASASDRKPLLPAFLLAALVVMVTTVMRAVV